MDDVGKKWATRIAVILLLGMTVGFGAVSVFRAGSGVGSYDFSHFYVDSRYLLEHGQLNTSDELKPGAGGPHLPWYLPLVTILFAPIAALPERLAGVVWFALCWACLLATVRWIGRSLTSLPVRDWLLTQMPAVILCGGAIFAQCHFNQLSFVVLALVAGSFGLLRRGREWSAGLVLAVAVLIKLVPAVFVLWWLVRRRWRALAGTLIGLVVLDVGLNLAVFGPARTWEYHERWYDNSVRGASAVAMISTGQENDYRNQGLGVVLMRLLSEHDPGDTATGPWADEPGRRQVKRVNVANLSKGAVAWVYAALSAVSAAALALVLRKKPRHAGPHKQRPPDDLPLGSDWPDRLAFALTCLAMLWFSPLVRQYYLIWCYPAISLLLAGREFHVRAGRTHRWIDVALAGWVVSQLLWIVPEMRSAGVSLWAVMLLGVAVAAEMRRPAKQDRDVTGNAHD